MLVYVNSRDFKTTNKRELVEATLLKKLDTTFLVKLPDGNTIVRKISRDLPEGGGTL